VLSLPERVVLRTVREPCHPLTSPAAPRCPLLPPAPQASLEDAVGGLREAVGPSAAGSPLAAPNLTVGLVCRDAGGGDASDCCVAAGGC